MRKVEFSKYLIIIINKLNLNEGILNLCLHYIDWDFEEIKESKLCYINSLLDSAKKDENLVIISKDWYKFHQYA